MGDQDKQKIRLLRITLIVGLLLMAIKFLAYYVTRSNAILTDALESFVNIIAGSFALYSVTLASKPRDKEHPYGHGKIEFLSAGAEGFLIIAAGLAIIIKSIYSFFFPVELQQLGLGIIFTVGTGAVNLVMGLILINKGRQWRSITIIADGKHLTSDALTSAGLIIGLVVIYFTQVIWLDNVIAIIFGVILVYNGYGILRRSVSGVMDEADMELIEEVIHILNKERTKDWIDFHNLRIIKYGSNLHIDCHITLPYYWDLSRVHNDLDTIEHLINENMGTKVELFIHPDPCQPSSCHICEKPDCPVRKHPFHKIIEWDLENVMQNQKHGMD